MSVIQKIREKYATLMVVAICVSLVAFLLMDAFVGPRSFFHHGNDVAEINGQSISNKDFANRIQEAEDIARQQDPKHNLTDEARQQVQEQVWNQLLNEEILGAEYNKLGIGFTDAELRDLTVTPDADPQIKAIRAFTNPQTGQFDPNRVMQFEQNMDRDPSGQSRQQWMQIEDYLQKSSLQRKFYSLVQQAIYYPKWVLEMENKSRNASADISYVNIPYSSIPDSAVTVSDEELKTYLDNHKKEFKQPASRSIEYVSFDAIPTAADTAQLLQQMNGLKHDLASVAAKDLPGFINRNSDIPFYDGYLTAAQMQTPYKDSITDLSAGEMFGPYLDNGSYTVAKMMEKKTIPDTVKIRHILITTQQGLPDTVAKQRIDSIAAAIKGGADFALMAAKYSDDPGSKDKGGEYTFSAAQVQDPNFSPNFRQFILFDGKAGDKKTVKDKLGYFYIEILNQKDFSTAWKVAYLSKKLDASEETDNAVYAQANQFAAGARTQAAFENIIKQKGLNKKTAENVLATDYTVPGIGQARPLVQWMYNDAKKGDVSAVLNFDDQYIVAVLTGIQKEGTASLADVRPQIEAAVKRQKKAAAIDAKITSQASLQAVSTKMNEPVMQAQNVNFATPFMPNAGFEPKVVGAVFNKALGANKISSPIYGNNGVYVLQVDSLTTHATPLNVQEARQSQESIAQNTIINQLFDMLKKQSDISDYRIKFY